MAAVRTRLKRALRLNWIVPLAAGLWIGAAAAGDLDHLPGTIEQVKPSIVGVGTYQLARRPSVDVRGTGFVVGDGRHALTNLHVIPDKLNEAKGESLAIFAGGGDAPSVRMAAKVAEDVEHDLVLLKFSDEPLPALTLGDSDKVREGQLYAFTGFPIGAILGLYPATHRGIIAAITPLIRPPDTARQLTPEMLERLKAAYSVFQLDATAYPGNSGSPLYDPDSGVVMGIINKVFVQKSKESALKNPSGISYAIPIRHARALLDKAGL